MSAKTRKKPRSRLRLLRFRARTRESAHGRSLDSYHGLLTTRRDTVRQQAHRPASTATHEAPHQRPLRLDPGNEPLRGQFGILCFLARRPRRGRQLVPSAFATLVLAGSVCGNSNLHGRTGHGPAVVRRRPRQFSPSPDRSTAPPPIGPALKSLPEQIMEYAEAQPEVSRIQAKDLRHLGNRAAARGALSRLTRSERLLRIYWGISTCQVPTLLGRRASTLEKAITPLAILRGETLVSNCGDAAHWLDLTTQNAVGTVNLTSGPDRLLHLWAHQVTPLHAPPPSLIGRTGCAPTGRLQPGTPMICSKPPTTVTDASAPRASMQVPSGF